MTLGLYEVNMQLKLAFTAYTNLANSIDPIPETPPFMVLAPFLTLGCMLVFTITRFLDKKLIT